jgi:hypothetical protein
MLSVVNKIFARNELNDHIVIILIMVVKFYLVVRDNKYQYHKRESSSGQTFGAQCRVIDYITGHIDN